MSKIIMFDMDGTLLDLAFDDFIWNECLPERHAKTHQLPLSVSKEKLYQFYQSHRHTLVWYSSTYWTKTVGVDVLKLQQEFQSKIQARSGCIELLQQLKEQGYICWLVTNADRASLRLKLDNIAIEHFFDVIISSEQVGYAKEDINFWQELQKLHPFNPDEIIFIDDTALVLKTAEKFGIQHLFTISQPSSLKDIKQHQDLKFKALDQLTELLSILNEIDRKDNDVKIA
ncbi:HAD-IA family hydrolase [Acinetobacter oleivorans]|uniref:HAD-IA family hydrolase n=1 Tax=Acinetobacter oleivorans TaxID=1148157 RepID=UPI0015806FF4|nr:HAD-IA family hydrolase [Acinetobacter oleivorans]NUG02360.1 HAD-IA family hydrolase [Acinetobacter oleivorans]